MLHDNRFLRILRGHVRKTATELCLPHAGSMDELDDITRYKAVGVASFLYRFGL